MSLRFEKYGAELVGTAVMILIGLSAIVLFMGTAMMKEYFPDESVRLLLTSILFAGGVALVIYSPIGRISGAHLNPVVTWAFWLLGRISGKDMVGYWLGQFVGGWLGAWLVVLLWGSVAANVHGGRTLPGVGVSMGQVFVVEVEIAFILVSFLFVLLCFKKLESWVGVLVGVMVVVLVYKTALVSGTSLNPARSLGPALVAGNFAYLWVYLVAPMVGGSLAVGFVNRVLGLRNPNCYKLRKHVCDPRNMLACSRG